MRIKNMCCGPSRIVNINYNGCGGFFSPYMPIGGFSPMCCGYGWGMPNMASVFGATLGFGLGNLAFRGIASLFAR